MSRGLVWESGRPQRIMLFGLSSGGLPVMCYYRAPFNSQGAAAAWEPARDVTWPRACFKDTCQRVGNGQADSGVAEGARQSRAAARERRGRPRGWALGAGARPGPPGAASPGPRPGARDLQSRFCQRFPGSVCCTDLQGRGKPDNTKTKWPLRVGGEAMSMYAAGRWRHARRESLHFLRTPNKQSFKNFSTLVKCDLLKKNSTVSKDSHMLFII